MPPTPASSPPDGTPTSPTLQRWGQFLANARQVASQPTPPATVMDGPFIVRASNQGSSHCQAVFCRKNLTSLGLCR